MLRRLLRPRSYTGLLTILVLVIVISPVLEEIRFGSRTLEVLLAIVLLSAIRDIARDERRHLWILFIGAVAVVSRIGSAVLQPPPVWLFVVALGSTIGFFVIAAWSISQHVFRQQRVTADTIRGAICVYLLLGLIWTMAFIGVAYFDPSTFPSLDHSAGYAGVYSTLQYFSFVTLTTLGYGDITPHGLVARQLAMAEAIVGQLFIAVAIAWLVGMYRGRRGAEDRSREERNDGPSS